MQEDDWSCVHGDLVQGVVNQTAVSQNRTLFMDQQKQYAPMEMMEQQGQTVNMLSEKVIELTQSQKGF